MKKRILLVTLLLMTLFSFNNVFGSTYLNRSNIEEILNYFGCGNCINRNEIYTEMISTALTEKYILITGSTSTGTWNGNPGTSGTVKIYVSENMPYSYDGTLIYMQPYYSYSCTQNPVATSVTKQNLSTSKIGINSDDSHYVFAPYGVYSGETTEYLYKPDYETFVVLDTSDFPTTLPAIVQETQPEETLAEIVGLLPIVMICLASWIGLRKALRLLSERLKRS